ncbi:MAG: VWA domain-containing protein [Candidatus Omnitrophica bacterium]|nr:VWA domain-containing protein [Candidatus Omnitrophota bacterium]MDD5430147.1 VWA domain-containing protein [Candidatus Omnitrophota bacterium]
MIFNNPYILFLLPLAIFVIWYADKNRQSPGVRFSSQNFLEKLPATYKVRVSRNIAVLRIAAVSLFIIALARPQVPLEDSKIKTEGIDIVLAIDCSPSMLAEDFVLRNQRVNRLEVVKDVVKDFIHKRRSDRIGIVAFSGQAYTICPLTLDYGWLLYNLDRIKIGMLENGTAIGLGLATSLNRLKDTKAKEKIVVILTDGINNTGKISPQMATQIAKALGVKVYTVGAGTKDLAPYPTKDMFGNIVYRNIKIDLDEKMLEDMASQTGARYWRATDTDSLKKIYNEIDLLEKTPFEEKGYSDYRELFGVFLILGLIALLLEVVLNNTWLRRIP